MPAALLQKELWSPGLSGVIINPVILSDCVVPSMIHAAAPLACWNNPSKTASALPMLMSVCMFSTNPLIWIWSCQSKPVSDILRHLSQSPVSKLEGASSWLVPVSRSWLPCVTIEATNHSLSCTSLSCTPSVEKTFVHDCCSTGPYHFHPVAVWLYRASLVAW